MNSEITVSVIVPVYNGSTYLRECLDSLQAQDLDSIEFICVDDGSTDSSPSILAEYANRDRRFKVITKTNTGFGNSMNVGIEAAEGKYVTSLDSDDYVSPDAFRKMAELAEKYELDFVKADRIFFTGDADSKSYAYNKIGKKDELYESVFNPSANPSDFPVEVGLPGLYRKGFLDDCDIRLNETPGASFQDTGLTAQALFNAKKALLLNEAVYYVRRDNESSSSLDKSKVFCICEEHDFIRAKAKQCRGEVSACLQSAAEMRMDGYWWNVQRLDPIDKERFILRAHEDFTRLAEAGELNRESFPEDNWERLQLLMNQPMEFYAQVQYGQDLDNLAELKKTKQRLSAENRRLNNELGKLGKECDAQRKEISKIKNSTSWKAGRAVTWIPRKVKNVAKSR